MEADDLAGREAQLVARERRAAAPPHDAELLAALAKERDALADAHDGAADARDAAALARRERGSARDLAASRRDQRSREPLDDGDPGFPDRFLSARDVDASAGDRADALVDERAAAEDRRRAHEDRRRAAADRDAATAALQEAVDAAQAEADGLRQGMESRTVIGQAQGLLMARYGITTDQAFALLLRTSQSMNVKLRDVAARMVQEFAKH